MLALSFSRMSLSMSLKDQLMKSGLANAKTARKAAHEKRMEAKDPNATTAKSLADQARQDQAERDRALNRQQQQERDLKAQQAAILQFIQTHRIDRHGGDQPYQFTADKKIKKIYVTNVQYDQLVRGQIAIVQTNEAFELIPKPVAERLNLRAPDHPVWLNAPADQTSPEDDPYKDYPIPDDLMW